MTGRPIIVAARRTAVGRIGGSLRDLPVQDLAAPVIQAVLADAGIDPGEVDDVVLGNAVGPGGNVARLSALAAGLPVSVPGVTVDRQCGSGLEAINLAARLIQAGAGDVFLAGGVESTSTAPWRVAKPTNLYRSPVFYDRARFAPDSVGDPSMIEAAEAVAAAYGIDRARQDRYALNSHRKAVASRLTGRFDREIVPLTLPDGRIVDRDECPRADTSLDRLAMLRPIVRPDGTVTAGNACPVNDGAAVVAVVSERKFQALGLTRGLMVVDSAAAGVAPNLLGTGPIPAVRKLLTRNPGLTVAGIDLIEFNEAFAAQVLACLDALEIEESRVCVGGGALALGHPYGASGGILATRLFSELLFPVAGTAPRRGLATLGIGGGLGLATLLESVS
ncbi:acetyl-CoA acetyltransferase [Azospirillum thiophilum]|uniref:Acetyl-CoA acetyltransferase n=1 Tax=Azospirillum thiophilum TaxID=528244 RepID=A0AAC8W0C3_9PROT|nr:thiolase family protein [Azospirillum thiophilum]ALG72707.1 acetyl-CoA acetyltransferase [Azospirillum thiophilum]KJR64375.1 acetyl-CoA acetyltransferase [Azospirillum thiophilum]